MPEVRRRLVQEALRIAREDERARRIGEHGASLFGAGDGVLTHCNAGALACVDYGTALAPCAPPTPGGRPCTSTWTRPGPSCRGRA